MKRFVIKVVIFALPIYVLMAWFALSLTRQYGSGEFGRLDGLDMGSEYAKMISSDSLDINRVFDYPELPDSFRVVTFGDSFSQQGRGGYQNYLADATSCDVLNVTKRPARPIELVIKMLNNGFFDTMTRPIVVVQSVERALVERLAEVDTTQCDRVNFYATIEPQVNQESMTNRFLSYVRLNMGFKTPVRRQRLNGDYFHGSKGDVLYYFKGDIYTTSQGRMLQAEQGFKMLSELFERKGVEMLFLVAPDKYKVYMPFMVKQRYLTADNTPLYERLNKFSCFVNPQEALTQAAAAGVKDIYRADDSHWSHIGSRIVARELVERIDLLR